MRKVGLARDQAHETLQQRPCAFQLDRNDHESLVIIVRYIELCQRSKPV